jgi:hypothetical protein
VLRTSLTVMCEDPDRNLRIKDIIYLRIRADNGGLSN